MHTIILIQSLQNLNWLCHLFPVLEISQDSNPRSITTASAPSSAYKITGLETLMSSGKIKIWSSLNQQEQNSWVFTLPIPECLEGTSSKMLESETSIYGSRHCISGVRMTYFATEISKRPFQSLLETTLGDKWWTSTVSDQARSSLQGKTWEPSCLAQKPGLVQDTWLQQIEA